MRVFLLAALAAFILPGCAALDFGQGARLDTANKQLAAKALEIDAMTTLTRDLLARGVITAPQAEKVHGALQGALDVLKTVQGQVAVSGDPYQAQGAVTAVDRAIAIALGLLRQYAPAQSAIAMKGRAYDPHSLVCCT